MMGTNDFKTVKDKKLDKHTTLKISKNLMNGRIFVEFKGPNMTVQRNFQDTFYGRKESEEFSKSITCIEDLRKHLGLDKK